MSPSSLSKKYDRQSLIVRTLTLQSRHQLNRIILPGLLITTLVSCGGSITVNTEGSGHITGFVGDTVVIDCGTNCTHTSDKAFGITLNANPLDNSSFVEWTGDGKIAQVCGTNSVCSLSIPVAQNFNVKAIFSDYSQPGSTSCRALLADGVKELFVESNSVEHRQAMEKFLCRTDWNAENNTKLKAKIGGIFAILFGNLGNLTIDNKLEIWSKKVCTKDLEYDETQEDTFELKQVADLALLQAYEDCLYDARNQAGIQCSINREPGLVDFVFSFSPTGEGLTLTDFKLDAINASIASNTDLPEYLTAFDDENAGGFDLTMSPDNLSKGSTITVHAKSKAFGQFSCSKQIPSPQ